MSSCLNSSLGRRKAVEKKKGLQEIPCILQENVNAEWEEEGKVVDMDLVNVVKQVRGEVILAKRAEIRKALEFNRLLIRTSNVKVSLEKPSKWEVPSQTLGDSKCFQAMATVTCQTYPRADMETNKSRVPIIAIEHVRRYPPYTTWISTPRNYVIHDKEETRHCPYFDETTFANPGFLAELDKHFNSDDEHDDDVGDFDVFYQTVSRLNKYEKEKSNSSMNVMWSQVMDEAEDVRKRQVPALDIKPSFLEDSFTPTRAVFQALQFLEPSYPTPEKLRRKFVSMLKKWNPTVQSAYAAGPNLDDESNMNCSLTGTSLDSYRQLFCRRCFMFNCQFHISDGVSPEYIPKKSNSTTVPVLPCSVDCYLHKQDINQLSANSELALKGSPSCSWGPNDASLCRVLLNVYGNNFCVIAKIVGTNCRKVEEFVKGDGRNEEVVIHTYNTTTKSEICSNSVPATDVSNTRQKPDFSMGITPQQFVNFVYKPCFHPGMSCIAAICDCVESKMPCEKYCTCNCEYRASGCRCKGCCDTMSCPCYAWHRECDPDLCSACGANEHDIRLGNCKNVGIQRQWRKHLKVGVSGIPSAGWGIFTMEIIGKGELICEYLGELITNEEADRRSVEYQKRCHTFLFELNSAYSVDAVRKGSKIRFANHADRPNTFVRIMKVNTDQRIGVYAARNIIVGEELFLNYKNVIEEHKSIRRIGKKRGRLGPSKQAPPRKNIK